MLGSKSTRPTALSRTVRISFSQTWKEARGGDSTANWIGGINSSASVSSRNVRNSCGTPVARVCVDVPGTVIFNRQTRGDEL